MPELTPESIATIVSHMNDDHGDSIAGYACYYGNLARVESARIRDFDAHAMRIVAIVDGATHECSIDFEHALTDTDDARAVLIAMARTSAMPSG
jgi:putative heme iron utilization protein